MSWVCIKAQTAIALGQRHFVEKPVSVAGCTYDFESIFLNSTTPDIIEEREASVYDMSYLYYTLFGATVTCLVGCIASCFYGHNDPRNVDPLVLAPFLRKYIQSRTPSDLQIDVKDSKGVIHTFETTNNQLTN